MAQTLLFQNARLIDGLADQPRTGVSILVTGERITTVEQGPLTPPTGAQAIDLGGKTVVPGLIDTHVHTTLMGDEGLPLFLAAGVTSARDVGGKLEKVQQIKADLNSDRQAWNQGRLQRYKDLLNLFEASPLLNYSQLRGRQSGPGAYALYYRSKATEQIPIK